jgi:hypothetical protein
LIYNIKIRIFVKKNKVIKLILGGIFIRNGIEKNNKKKFKTFLIRIIFWFLGRGFQSVASFDRTASEEIKGLDDLMYILLKVDPNGPSMVMQKKAGKINYLGTRVPDNVELAIYFKNIEAAFLVLTGQLGIAQAYAEHRFTLKGDIFITMPLVRALNITEAYLFPGFMARKLMKRMPDRTNNKFNIYMATILGIH